MDKASVWPEIFDLQAKLNHHVFNTMGIAGNDTSLLSLWAPYPSDRDVVLVDSKKHLTPLAQDWILKYSRAMWHELHEMEKVCADGKTSFARDLSEESVDVLHFLVSIGILARVNPANIEIDHSASSIYLNMREHLYLMRDDSIKLERLIKRWKWWSKPKDVSRLSVENKFKDLLSQLMLVFKRLHISGDKLLEEYKKKRETNMARVDSGYVGKD